MITYTTPWVQKVQDQSEAVVKGAICCLQFKLTLCDFLGPKNHMNIDISNR